LIVKSKAKLKEKSRNRTVMMSDFVKNGNKRFCL
jgi:hypothetical protein